MKKAYLYLSNNIHIKIFVSVILTTMMVLGFHIAEGSDFELFDILSSIIVLVLVYCVVTVIYASFDRMRCGSIISYDKRISGTKIYWISFFILTIFYLVCFLALYPGIFAFDAPSQLLMYMQDQISEWHPVLHTVIIGKLMVLAYQFGGGLTEGVALYTGTQILLTALCFAYLLKYVYENTSRMVVWGISCLFLATFPPIQLQVLSVTKDSYFMSFMVLAMTITSDLLIDEVEFYNNKMKIATWIFAVTGMLIFRNNCVYAFPVLVITMIIVSKKKKNTIAIITVVILIFATYKLAYVPSVVTVGTNDCEKMSVPVQQLVRIYLDEDAILSDEERKVIEELIYEDGRTEYIPTSADRAKAALNMRYFEENKKVVIRCYINVISRNPKQAVMAFLELNCGLWYPIYDLTLYGDGREGYWVVRCYQPIEMVSRIPRVMRYYKLFEKTEFAEGKIIKDILLAPAFFWYIFCIFLGYAVIIGKKSYIAVFVFIAFYWATFLLGPMALVRYVTWLMAVLPLYSVIIFGV